MGAMSPLAMATMTTMIDNMRTMGVYGGLWGSIDLTPPPSHVSMGLAHLLWPLWLLWGAMWGYPATLKGNNVDAAEEQHHNRLRSQRRRTASHKGTARRLSPRQTLTLIRRINTHTARTPPQKSGDARNTSCGRNTDTKRRTVVRPPTRSACGTKKRRRSQKIATDTQKTLSHESAHKKNEQQEGNRGEKLPKRHRTTPSPCGTKERENEVEANRKEVIRNRNAPAKGLPAATVAKGAPGTTAGRGAAECGARVAAWGCSADTQLTHRPWARGAEIPFGVPRRPGVPEQRAVPPPKGTHSARRGAGLVQASWRGDVSQYRVRVTEEGNKTKENTAPETEGERGEGDAGKRPQEIQNAGRETSRYEGGTREESHKKRGKEVEKMTSAREAECRGVEVEETSRQARGSKRQTRKQALHSTPGSQGSASDETYASKNHQADYFPCLQEDLATQETVTFDPFLKLILPSNESTANDDSIGRISESPKFRQLFADYQQNFADETDLYHPFVELRAAKAPSSFVTTPLLFVDEARRGYRSSTGPPRLMHSSSSSSVRAADLKIGARGNIPENLRKGGPTRESGMTPFRWIELLGFSEFKVDNPDVKPAVPAVPKQEPERKRLRAPRPAALTDCETRFKQSASSNSSWGKRSRDPSPPPECAPKQSKTIPPEIQYASYAVELLSHSDLRTHVIGALVTANSIQMLYYDRSIVVKSDPLFSRKPSSFSSPFSRGLRPSLAPSGVRFLGVDASRDGILQLADSRLFFVEAKCMSDKVINLSHHMPEAVGQAVALSEFSSRSFLAKILSDFVVQRTFMDLCHFGERRKYWSTHILQIVAQILGQDRSQDRN
ncbi:hypothetical protein C8R44DRAFT_728497 [Mycena epipterygia]|nr:hypothetical protein C8R44DRAFT_728497 [Mycena epipterygia]